MIAIYSVISNPFSTERTSDLRKSYYTGIVCILLCALTLVDSRAFFGPYLLAAVYALYCLHSNQSLSIDRKSRPYRIITVASLICAVFVVLANYGIWIHPVSLDVRTPMFVRLCKATYILIIMSGSFVSVLNILIRLVYVRNVPAFCRGGYTGDKTYRFFLIPFVIMLCVYGAVWIGCYFPGLLSLDSIDQVRQIITREYSNHQPFYHTQLLGLFIRPAIALSGNINAGVAAFIFFQIIVMAATFAFVINNMAIFGFPKWACIIATVWYTIMPFHIMYSVTVWKDVLFGAFVTLMIVFFARSMNKIGRPAVNYTGFALSSLIICLIRSNGLFAYIFVFAAVILLARDEAKLLVIMLFVIIASFVLKHPVLGMYNVTQPDTVESLSIPLQQIARVIADDGKMSDEDMKFLSEFIDVSAIKDNYDPNISDPIKNMIRDYNNQEYLSSHMADFAKVYLRTVIHNPLTVVIAWVDSTCGYWNSGYSYWIWYWDIEQNDLGISRTVNSPRMLRFMDEYLWLFYNNRILQVFTSIGLHVWLILMFFAKYTVSKCRTGIISCVTILAIVLSLLVSSPVYSEFRYMYALFCCLPILGGMEVKNENNMQ